MARLTICFIALCLTTIAAQAQSAPPSALTLSGHTNSAAPNSSNGAEGNWFFDVDSGNVWGPKASGFWPTSATYSPSTTGIPAGKSLVNAINATAAPYNVTAATADNATGLQAAINAAVAANVPLYIPAPASGCYKYTAPLTISGNLSIVGDWVAGNWNGGINVPLGTPPITGSVLCPSANGSDAIDISGTSLQVNISNLGILFQTTFGQSSTTTGDAIHYVTTGTTQGLTDPSWNNVMVWGHDGNHYAYRLNNAIYGQYNHVEGFGGGLLKETSTSGNFGNQTWVQLYGQTVVGGSANGVDLSADTANHLAIMTFVRPQIIIDNVVGVTPGANPPTSAQSIWVEDGNVRTIRKVQPDLETNVSSNITLGHIYQGNDPDWASIESTAATINEPAWANNGLMFGPQTRILNDTTSSGAGSITGMYSITGTTVTATNATTYPVLTSLYIGPPVCGTNCTATHLDAIYTTGEIFTTSDITVGAGMFISGTSQLNTNAAAATTAIGNGTTTGTVSIGGPSNTVTLGGTVIAGGSAPTNTGSCAINTQLGGKLAGSFKANGACAGGTVIFTFVAATTGFACEAHDLTTPADAMNPTAYSPTTVTFTGTMAASDLVTFMCEGF